MLRDHGLFVIVAGLTTLVIVLVGRRWSGRGLATALAATIELIGATTIFFAVNLAAGVVLVLAIRKLTPFYPSLYEIADTALLLLSLVQAAILESWRRLARDTPARRR